MEPRPRIIDRSIMHPINMRPTRPLLKPTLKSSMPDSKLHVKKIAGNQISPAEMATLRTLRKMRGQ